MDVHIIAYLHMLIQVQDNMLCKLQCKRVKISVATKLQNTHRAGASTPLQFNAMLLGATLDPLCSSRPLSAFCILARICICSAQLPQRGRDPYLHTRGQTFAGKCKQATDANTH